MGKAVERSWQNGPLSETKPISPFATQSDDDGNPGGKKERRRKRFPERHSRVRRRAAATVPCASQTNPESVWNGSFAEFPAPARGNARLAVGRVGPITEPMGLVLHHARQRALPVISPQKDSGEQQPQTLASSTKALRTRLLFMFSSELARQTRRARWLFLLLLFLLRRIHSIVVTP